MCIIFFFYVNTNLNLPQVNDIIMLLPVPIYAANVKSLHIAPIRKPKTINNIHSQTYYD